MSSTDRFKFRVYDNDAGEYIDDGALLDGRTGRISGNGNYTIEQCTGLYSVNDELIFEGDIVRYNWPGTPSEIVAWNPKTCKWVTRHAKDTGMVFASSLAIDSPLRNDGFIIVGNIHEVKND